METHGPTKHTAYIRLSPRKCLQCGICSGACSFGALVLERPAMILHFRPERCAGCGECIELCPTRALTALPPEPATATALAQSRARASDLGAGDPAGRSR